jgi:hypothetical protein
MTEFMVNMHSNPDAMHMMQGNKMMMGDNGMQMMMKRQHDDKNFMHGTMANPEMMQSMMGEMMKDGKTMAAMMQMMQQGGDE